MLINLFLIASFCVQLTGMPYNVLTSDCVQNSTLLEQMTYHRPGCFFPLFTWMISLVACSSKSHTRLGFMKLD